MTRRPVIGLATQTLDPVAGSLPPGWAVGRRYVEAVTAAGGLPWPVPCLGDEEILRAVYDRLDGLLLPGGVDLDPALYGQTRHPRCDRSDPDRDAAEMRLARWALEDRKPVLGVCRGIQTLNVARGGDLYQDLADLRPDGIKHDYFSTAAENPRDHLAHPVRIESGSRLAGVMGVAEAMVNSMHHQGIHRLAPGLRPVAWAPDGLIEGIEGGGGGFLLGVQWHPEELTADHPPMRRLFAALVEAAAGRIAP